MSKAVALLAGLGAGYMNAEDKKREQKRQDERDARERTVFDQQQADRDRAQVDREELRAAAADRVPTEVQLPGPVMPDEAQPTGIKVGSRYFAEQGVANEAAAAENAPGAARKRVMDTLTAQGKPLEADQIRTSGLQADAAQVTLDRAKVDEANRAFDDGIRKALQSGGAKGLAQFMSDSTADGKGGAVKFQAQENLDGTWQMMRVGEDGSLTPYGGKFTADERGYATAGMLLSRTVPEAAKVAHFQAEAKAESDRSHQRTMEGIAQKSADTQEQYRKDQAENMRQQRALESQRIAALTAKAAAPGGPIQIGVKDMRDFEGDLTGQIKDLYPIKDGATPTERSAMQAQQNHLVANAQMVFQNSAQAGVPITASMALQALKLRDDRANVKIAQVNGQPREVVMVGSTPVVVSGPLQQKQPAAGAAQVAAAGGAQAPGQPLTGTTVAGLQQQLAAQGVSPAAVAPPPQAPKPVAGPSVPADKAALLAPLTQEVQQVSQQMAAAAQSGDQAAIQRYAALLEQVRAKRRDAAVHQLGEAGATEYLSNLPI